MRYWSLTAIKSLVLPGGVLLLCVAALASSGWLTLALPALSFLYYCALAGGMLLAWRFHSSRIFLSLVVLFLAGQAIALFGSGSTPQLVTTLRTVAALVPLDFVLIALMHERGFTLESLSPVALFLFVQSVVVFVFCRAATPSSATHAHRIATAISFPHYTWVLFAIACIFLGVRFLWTRKPVDSALLWSLCAFFLSLRFAESARNSTMYAATSACILALSIIENSYLLAYHDELTSLPSRRAFNDALVRLQDPYTIAAVDIDHFKNFNDTYGHDIGDQVLRLVASNLARVTGGGQAYRCGGEEFTVLFPGRSASEVIEDVELLRRKIEASEFHVRGGDRREMPRGPERRKGNARGRTRKGDVIRELSQPKSATTSVTVSIGVASSGKGRLDTDVVLQAADKALYRAKANGRNRVEVAAHSKKKQARAAGIA